ncbi:protein zer-1 homolog [Daphnia magna]|uniref:protein zer-1 homolog n=1 Tax=Daphnia magna TaxID=35525 RepID=UPI001E1BBD21|nr:protein zer-1 homolog [Daphnia magna]
MPFKSILVDNTPYSLQDICLQSLGKYLNSANLLLGARDGLSLPTELCERLLQYQIQEDRDLDAQFVSIFEDTSCTRLKRVSLRLCTLKESEAEILFRHELRELELIRMKVSTRVRRILNEYSQQLISLTVSECIDFFSQPVTELQITAPKLRKFVLQSVHIDSGHEFFSSLLRGFPNLAYLDLSECNYVGDLSCLLHCPNLSTLILYNVSGLQDAIEHICKLVSLRHLDISQSSDIRGRSNEKNGIYERPNQTLATLVESLPYLKCLDISGTNLAGTGVAEKTPSGNLATDIPGLRSRISNPLDMLGLYGTSHEACHRHHIPALCVTGDANEEQILAAGKAYIDRAEMMQGVLNDLYGIIRPETYQNPLAALDIILQAMENHLTESHIQISGSASLFYIVKSPERERSLLNVRIKQKTISVLLKAMDMHSDDPTMMRNGCLTLCQFKIPQDVLFSYERLILILLHVVGDHNQDDFVRRIAIYLLNSLACQVDGKFKQLVGSLGAIETMLQLIEEKLRRNVCDDVMEVAWSTMWNVTDETALNCKRFLRHSGMQFFLNCLKAFPNHPELLRNMMGLLGNVAEVEELRPQLMTSEFITVFSDLLYSTSDGIEVSYNAAGVLAHIASDGAECWKIKEPKREDVLNRIVTAIDRWDLDSKRNINYRSFEPILRLLDMDHTPQCQYWAVWALANLTRVYAEKYCRLLKEENGFQILEKLVARTTDDKVRRFAKNALEGSIEYLERNAMVSADEHSDDLEG